MPNPSAILNIFWPCSNIFEGVQYFLNIFKYFWPCSNMWIYKVKSCFLTVIKKFDCVQKILNRLKKIWMWKIYFWTSRWNRHKSEFVSFWSLFRFCSFLSFKNLFDLKGIYSHLLDKIISFFVILKWKSLLQGMYTRNLVCQISQERVKIHIIYNGTVKE